MAISELQIALVGAGAAAVALVWGYNAWQERRHRKTADRIFKGGQGDALLGSDDRGPGTGDSDRREPHFAVEASDELPEAIGDAAADMEPARDDSAPQSMSPVEGADAVADCVLTMVATEAVPASAVRTMQNAWSAEVTRPVHWLARNAADGAWQPVAADDTGRYRQWAVALQLVDRRGPVSEDELARFFGDVQQVAAQTGAALELPARGEVVAHAAALDQFCAGVDIQFVLHVVEASGGIFAGTKLRGVAEAAGLALEADGVFRARDAFGGELFAVANLGAERFDAESIKSLTIHGLTLSLDVPRVAEGVLAFDRMLATARQLATALGGVLVDAQRAPLADAMIAAIRARTAELQQRMKDGGIVPGSTRALRLFS